MIDNFEIIKKNLTFESNFDRYIVHIIKRAKDDKGKMYGVNETNRLLKTFYITSLEYLDGKIPVIKDLCESNGARAYILPQVRDNSACLKNLLKVVVDNLDNPTIKPDHLIRTSFCGYHGSRDKKWIFDLDNDNMIEYRKILNFGGTVIEKIEWTPEKVLDFIKEQLRACGKDDSQVYMIPTRSGNCIVSSPFDLKKAYTGCNMMYEGVGKVAVGSHREESDPLVSKMPYYDVCEYKEINGWLIKDGMALLYLPDSINK